MQQKHAVSRTGDLDALTRLLGIASQCIDPQVSFQECLDSILQAAIELTLAERGNIQLLDTESGILKIAAQRGFGEAFLRFFADVTCDDASACGAAMRSAQRVVVEDIAKSPMFAAQPSLDVLLAAGVRAVQSTPLVSSTERVVGMISTHFGAPHRLQERELLFMDLLARLTADYVERRRGQEQFIQSQRTFFELVERAPFGIYIVDSQFRIAQMNAGSQTGAFRNVRPIIKRNFAEAMRILWPEPVAAQIISVFRHTLETGEPYYSHGFRNPRHDVNSIESYEWELHRLTLPDGQHGVICYYFDSTRVRETEQALRRSEKHLELVSNTVPALIFYLDQEGRYQTCNDTFTSWFGLPREQIIGLPVRDFVGEEAWKIIGPQLERAYRGETVDFESEAVYRFGGARWIHAVYTPHRDVDGTVLGVVVLATDITRNKRLLQQEQTARREAEAANRLKDEFLATVSHELRTPLTCILGWAHMLRQGGVDERKMASALEVMERNARIQSRIIDDLLDVSRIVSGKVRLDARPVDPAALLNAAVDGVLPAAEAKRVEIQKVLDRGVANVSGDAERLQQIFWNLMSNAIKFTPAGGRIQVRLERKGSHVKIVVSDTGIGIKQEFLPYVFERFRQADATATRPYGGLGLGLAIVRHLVELHGGEVYAESAGEGRGATFTIKLPIIAKPAGTDVQGVKTPELIRYFPELEASDRLDGLKVLAVDDEPDMCEMLRTMIEKSGAEVAIANSAEQALAMLGRRQFDLIVSDIAMPEKDGYQLMQEIRHLAPDRGGAIPAIALTAFARVEDRLRALRSGYQMHVPKPIEYAELITVMTSLAGRNRD
jgi:PAS domain S-box-containing protein